MLGTGTHANWALPWTLPFHDTVLFLKIVGALLLMIIIVTQVPVPKGETLQGAFERAKRREPPSKVLVIPNEAVRLLASLCRELQEMTGGQPFMLCQASVAKLFGHSSHRTISNWIAALKTLEVLKLAEAATPNARAARYFYIE
jgi:hypothetical protein